MKLYSITLIIICLSVLFVGCNKNEIKENNKTEKSDEVIKVMENVYVDYINDIYLDKEKYLGKTIEIEGMFTIEKDEENKNHMYVYRIADIVDNIHEHDIEDSQNHEGNQTIEAKCGLEFSYEKNIPKENDWIRVIGRLREKDGIIIIDADSVEIMNERGMEKVTSFY